MFTLLTLLCSVVTEIRRPPCATDAQEPFERHLFLVLSSIFYHAQVCTVLSVSWLPRTQWKRLGEIKRPWALCSKQCITWPHPTHSSVFQQTSGDAHNHEDPHTHIHTQLTQLFLALRHNTVQPRLSFRHRACCRVIALLINVSPIQDNALVFTVRFSRLAMRDLQWCNLLSVHYALL